MSSKKSNGKSEKRSLRVVSGAAAGEQSQAESVKAAKTRKTAKAEKKEKKMSQLDAAAAVLANAKEPMNTKAMLDAMTAGNLWKSPGGKTPAATLYAAILREIQNKKADARFKKAGPGTFALKS